MMYRFVLFIAVFINSGSFAQTSATGSEHMVASEDGAWCWFSDPRAVYHRGSKDRVYFCSINSKGDVVIMARDYVTKKTETFILHDTLEIDDHNVPSILFLPDGRLLTIYSEHNGRFFSRTSKYPEDISEWEEERLLTFNDKLITYSHPVMLSAEKNRIYLFWRGRDKKPVPDRFDDWQQYFSYSDDEGRTWQEGRAFLSSKGLNNTVYLKVCSDNISRIDFVFTNGHPGIADSISVYHMFYKQGAFYQTNGKKIGNLNRLPVPINRVNKVYDWQEGKARSWISDITLNAEQRPVIAYSRYPSPTDHRYHYAFWDGKKWVDQEMCEAGKWMPLTPQGQQEPEPYYSGGMALDHNDPANVYLSKPSNGFFEIEHWQYAGNKWNKKFITQNSTANNVRPFVVFQYPHGKPIVMWMNGSYYHYTNYRTSIIIKE